MGVKEIGDYTLIKELGWDPLGRRILAEHSLLKKRYILNLFSKEQTLDSAFMERFEREVAFLAQLVHPNIVPLHNAANIDGYTFTVTELFGSNPCNLADYLEKKRYELHEEEIVSIAKQIAEGLEAIHEYTQEGHGSFTLNNILLRPGKEGMEVALSDIGLARVVGPFAASIQGFTHAVKTLSEQRGQPEDHHASVLRGVLRQMAFLAPEQKWGKQPTATPQSDAYAFGVLLYFLLVGEFPEGYFDMPSKRLSALTWNWDLLICRCLQSDPARRPTKLKEILEELVLKSSHNERKESRDPKPLLKSSELKRPAFDADPSAIFRTEATVIAYRPERPKRKEGIQPLLTDMVVIPKGVYMRGSQIGARDEMPRHEIFLDSFAIDIHPVTNEQFVRFLDAMGEEKDSHGRTMVRLRDARIKRRGNDFIIESGYAKHPVVGITWYGAIAYAKWVGKRLPFEAEWEIAACGGKEDFVYPTGMNIEQSQANFFHSDTTSVMSYLPNAIGLYDMAGNVYEWCYDWYDHQYYNSSRLEPNQPKGPPQGTYRVLRGGCWKS